MKLQIVSDLHVEFDGGYHLPVVKDRDLLILAGDIGVGTGSRSALNFIAEQLEHSPVIYVPGNHEYYGTDKLVVDAFWRQKADDIGPLYYLNGDAMEYLGVRFFGAEWCSNFWKDTRSQALASKWLTDFRLTTKGGLGWTTGMHLTEYETVSNQLAALSKCLDVVITHFPPTKGGIDQVRFAGDALNPYFVNDAPDLVNKVGAKLWISGHTHASFDYNEGVTRVVGNPKGYPVGPVRQRYENPNYNPVLTVDV